MNTPTQPSQTPVHAALLPWIISGIALIAIAIGAVIVSRATNDDAQLKGILFLVFGGLGLVTGLIVGFIFHQQAKAVRAIASGSSEVWARWTCSPEEAGRFLEQEQTRLTVSWRQRLTIMAGALIMGLVSPFFWSIVRHHSVSMRERVLIAVGFLVLGAVLLLISPFFAMLELKRAKRCALGEIVISEGGLLAGGSYYPWRTFNWALQHVALESGSPAVLKFDFLAGTLPGSALIGSVMRTSYILGATEHTAGRTQAKETVRVPVPADQESRAQELVSTLLGSN